MTNKLAVIINSLKVPKIKKILVYEMKFLLPNYNRPQIPVLSVHCPQLHLLNPPPAEQNSWVRHCRVLYPWSLPGRCAIGKSTQYRRFRNKQGPTTVNTLNRTPWPHTRAVNIKFVVSAWLHVAGRTCRWDFAEIQYFGFSVKFPTCQFLLRSGKTAGTLHEVLQSGTEQDGAISNARQKF